MTDKERWEQAIARLVEMTRDDALTWQRSIDVKRSDATGDVYEASIQGRRVVVWEYRFRSYDEPQAEEDIAIEFVDMMGKTEWRWPEAPSRWSLLDAIRYQLAGAGDFLKHFLNAS